VEVEELLATVAALLHRNQDDETAT